MVLQTFFVSALSGSIFQVRDQLSYYKREKLSVKLNFSSTKAISVIARDWTEIIDLVAQSLSSQSIYFMQILLITTTAFAGFELLRPIPLLMAALRERVGPNLTEKERNKTYMGLHPLNNPPEFPHVDTTSRLVRVGLLFDDDIRLDRSFSSISKIICCCTGVVLHDTFRLFRHIAHYTNGHGCLFSSDGRHIPISVHPHIRETSRQWW